MSFLTVLIFISSFSFILYGIAYFTSTKMKSEFKRFGLEKLGALTAVLELLGAFGLLVGMRLHPLLLVSAGGLAILMLLGVVVRIQMKDSLLISLPATLYMLLNAYIFFRSLQSAAAFCILQTMKPAVQVWHLKPLTSIRISIQFYVFSIRAFYKKD